MVVSTLVSKKLSICLNVIHQDIILKWSFITYFLKLNLDSLRWIKTKSKKEFVR